MRVIKFRAWNGGKFVNDYYNHNHFISIKDGKLIQVQHDDVCHDGIVYGKPEVVTLQQFTGLLDINGVEIYEGDIVRLWYAPLATAIGFVSFDNGGFVFNTEKATPNKSFVGECVDCGNYFTVIGNIHETPELLK